MSHPDPHTVPSTDHGPAHQLVGAAFALVRACRREAARLIHRF